MNQIIKKESLVKLECGGVEFQVFEDDLMKRNLFEYNTHREGGSCVRMFFQLLVFVR